MDIGNIYEILKDGVNFVKNVLYKLFDERTKEIKQDLIVLKNDTEVLKKNFEYVKEEVSEIKNDHIKLIVKIDKIDNDLEEIKRELKGREKENEVLIRKLLIDRVERSDKDLLYLILTEILEIKDEISKQKEKSSK
jgi:uncharacterized protein (DUF342 family)